MEPDEDLFSSGRKGGAASSKLASIFAQEPDYSSGTASLSYKGAKAPIKQGTVPSMSPVAASATSASSSGDKSALYAGLATLLRYDAARVGSVVGQRGCALMRHPSGSVLFLVYDPADPQKRDVMVPVTETFLFMTQSPAYGFFYDQDKNYWCVQLPSAEQLDLLAKQIALAKGSASITAGNVSVVTQELFINASETRAISNGDAVKIKYNMYSFVPNSKEFGPLLSVVGTEDKPKQLKLGGGKDIVGLEQGLVGMKKGSRRILIVPSNLGYGAAGNAALNVPANTVLLLEVELLKVKFADKPAQPALMPGTPLAAPSTTSPARPPVIVLGGAVVDVPSDSTPAADSAADGDKPDSRRNSLLHRMAALGGFAMPNMNPAHTAHVLHHPVPTHTDSSEEQHQNHPATQQQHPSQPQQQQQQLHQPTPPPQPTQLTHGTSGYQPGAPHEQPQQQQPQMHQPQQFGQQHPQQQQQYNPYSQTSPPPPQQQHMGGYHPQSHPGMSQHHPNAGSMSHQPGYSPYGPPQSHLQQPFGAPPPNASFYSLDSKLDAIQAQLNRCLGTGNAYDPNPALSGQQMIKGLNLLLQERDDLKVKSDKSAETITELQAKISTLHDRNESFLTENQKLSEARFANFQDELKMKNTQIVDLQETVRNLNHDLSAKTSALQESELKAQKQLLELDLAKTEVKDRKELERQVVLLQIQLDEATKKHEIAGETVKQSLSGELAKMKQDLMEKEKEITDLQTKHEQELKDAQEHADRFQVKIKDLESAQEALQKKMDTLTNELSASKSLVTQKESEIASFKLKLDHALNEHDGIKSETDSRFTQLKEEYETRLAALQLEVTRATQARVDFESNMEARIQELHAEHAAALEAARAEGANEGQSEALTTAKAKIDEVVTKAKLKMEHLQEQVDALTTEKTELETQVASLTEEKQAIIDQSKSVIAKIRVQVQEQQQRHEEALQAAVAAAEAATAASTVSSSSTGGSSVDWKEKVKKSMSTLFQTLAGSLNESGEDQFTRLQIRDLLMKDMKQVTVHMLQVESIDSEAPSQEESEPATTTTVPDSVEPVEAESLPPPLPAEPVEEPASNHAYQCADCDQRFALESHLNSHRQVAHPPAEVVSPTTATADDFEVVASPEESKAEETVVPVVEPVVAAAAEPEPEVKADESRSRSGSSAAATSSASAAPLSKAQKKKNKKKNKAAAAASKQEEDEEATPSAEPAVEPPVVAEPVVESASVPEPEAAAPVRSEEEVASAEESIVPGGPTIHAEEPSTPVAHVTEEEEVPNRARNGAVSTTSSSTASSTKAVVADPFDESEPEVKPVLAAAAAPVVGSVKPKVTSLFGDDDDDDLFPAPATAAAKLKAEPKKSLFDDDDF